MTQEEQQSEFSKKLEQLIEYFRSEYQITYASVVGVLMVAIFNLLSKDE
jgi:uncharacterized alpha/beta hydrolase family protein